MLNDFPAKIARFHVKEKVGEGAFGIVLLAYDPHLAREVALKIPHSHVRTDVCRVKQFLGEAQAAARLRHPHIIPVFDAGEHENLPYIAFAFIEGPTLEKVLDEGPMEIERAVRLVRALAEALAHAHRLDIVHRDVKPSNILLDGKDDPHLGDFGVARRFEGKLQESPRGLCGTLPYMAPEQLDNQECPASDQYSLGVVLYQLLCGRRPFDDQDPRAWVYHLKKTPPPPLRRCRPEVSRDLEAICLTTLAKQPENRYRTCQNLAEDLRRWQERDPVSVRSLGTLEKLLYWTRRDPKLALSLLGTLLCLLGATLFTSFSYRNEARARQEAVRATEDRDKALKEKGEALSVSEEALQKEKEALGISKNTLEENKKVLRDLEDALAKKNEAMGKADLARREAQEALYYRLTAAAEREIRDGNLSRARELVERCKQGDLGPWKGWEWNHLNYRCFQSPQVAEILVNDLYRLAFSPEVVPLLAMAKGNTVILWRFTTGTGRTKQLTSPNGEFARISCLTFGLRNMENKKSLVLAAGDEKGHLLVWDVESQKVINDQANFHKGAVRCVAFASESGLLASGGDDGQVRLWNLGGKKPDRTPRRHRAPIRSVAFSPKAGFFDLSRPQPLAPLLCSACQENEVRLWVLGPGVGNDQYLPGYTMGTFSPDGAWFALANEKGTVSLVRYDHIDRPIPLFEGQVGEIQKAKVWGKNSRRVSTAGLSHGKYRHGLGHRKPPVPNQLAVTCL